MEKELLTVTEKEEMLISVAEDMAVPPTAVKEVKQESSDWNETKKPEHFLTHLKEKLSKIPTATQCIGNKSLVEQAMGQYKRLDDNISKTLRNDYDFKLDAKGIERVRTEIIYPNVKSLERMLDAMIEQHKARKADDQPELVKEANTPHFAGIQMNVSAFEMTLVRILINGTVSGGHDMEEMYVKVKDKYKLSDREELAIFQILSDFGYPTFQDRLRIGEKDVDTTESGETGEWAANYPA